MRPEARLFASRVNLAATLRDTFTYAGLTFAASAADLKFLQRSRQARLGTSNRKAALEHKVASAPLLPKFVPGGAALSHELRKRGTRACPFFRHQPPGSE